MNAAERAFLLLAAVLVAVVSLAAMIPAAAAVGPRERVVVALRTPGPGVPAIAYRLAQLHGGSVRGAWGAAGVFSVELPASAVGALRRDPRVLAVESNHVFSIAATGVPSGIARSDAAPAASGGGEQVDVDVAVLDSGVDASHPDLRVAGGVDCWDGTCAAVTPVVDELGHGTHVAGTIAALDDGRGVVGMAPGARVWSVRVLDREGNGTLEGVVAGLDWVRTRADVIEVVNASFGCECTSAVLDTAVARLAAAGTVLVVASGNRSVDAARISPANAPDVIAVSAYADLDGQPGARAVDERCAGLPDVDDAFASFSNFGAVIDLAAPGVCISSTVPVARGSYGVSSGTSMAAPHVAGAAARYIIEREVPRDAARAATVRAGLVREWSAPQAGGCGFTGGRSHEPVLHLSRCGQPVAATTAAATPAAGPCQVAVQAPRPGVAPRGGAARAAAACVAGTRFGGIPWS